MLLRQPAPTDTTPDYSYCTRKHRPYVIALGGLLALALVLNFVALCVAVAFSVTDSDGSRSCRDLIFQGATIAAIVVSLVAWRGLLDPQRVHGLRRTKIVMIVSGVGTVTAFMTVVTRVSGAPDRLSISYAVSAYSTAASGVLLVVGTVVARRSARHFLALEVADAAQHRHPNDVLPEFLGGFCGLQRIVAVLQVLASVAAFVGVVSWLQHTRAEPTNQRTLARVAWAAGVGAVFALVTYVGAFATIAGVSPGGSAHCTVASVVLLVAASGVA